MVHLATLCVSYHRSFPLDELLDVKLDCRITEAPVCASLRTRRWGDPQSERTQVEGRAKKVS